MTETSEGKEVESFQLCDKTRGENERRHRNLRYELGQNGKRLIFVIDSTPKTVRIESN